MISMTQNYDAIVIGAGVVGVSVAFHLAERGLKPVILERREIASGATGRSSGVVRLHYDFEMDSRLAWVSFQYFRNWRVRVGGECGFTRTGVLNIVPARLVDHMRTNVEIHRRIGIPTSIISADDVKRLVPSFYTDDFEMAAYEPESGYADPVLTANSFLAAAKACGAIYLQDCQVTGVNVSSGKVTGVKTLRDVFSAPVIINAAGPWASRIAAMAGVKIPIKTAHQPAGGRPGH